MKPVARIALAGVASVALLKLFTTVFIPMLGMLIGLLLLTAKIAVIAAVAYFLWTLLRGRREDDDEDAASEMADKIEIVVEDVVESDGADGQADGASSEGGGEPDDGASKSD